MQIYQGEPITFKINQKTTDSSGEEHYVSSFDDYVFEALMKDSAKKIIKTWSTEDETIIVGTETVDGETAAKASWWLTGVETALLKEGLYSIELARIINSGRGIGIASDVVQIKEALIREGI